MRSAEKELRLDHLAPAKAIEALVRFSWDYTLVHSEFITLANSENLHRAKQLKKCKPVPLLNSIFDARIDILLQRGVRDGEFRKGVDASQLTITIAAINSHYLGTCRTGSIV